MDDKWRSLVAEALGTALLVFFGVGVATLSFGYRFFGTSRSAGVVATALTFGIVLLVLVYAIGPLSGCHINPAVTIGFLVARRMSVVDAVSYWVAQVIGGIAGAAALFGLFHLTTTYHKSVIGLGTNGYGTNSMIGAKAGGALIAEIVMTFIFVYVILAVTQRANNALVAGLVIGLSLTLVHLFGILIDGTSVNPARSLGPALFIGGSALSQLWVFIVGPLIGGAVAAIVFAFLHPPKDELPTEIAPAPEVTAAMPPSEAPAG